MKISKILYKILIVTVIAIIGSSYICYATTSTSLPDLDQYKPTASMGTKSKNIVTTILNVMTVIGVIAIVVWMAMIGFGTILGSAGDKAAGKEKYIGLVVASILLIAGSSIAKLIISVAESM